MKSRFVSVAFFFLATTAFALPRANAPWNEIRNCPGTFISDVGELAALGGAFNTCVEGNNFRSITPVMIQSDCTGNTDGNPSHGTYDGHCATTSQEYAYMPISQVRGNCELSIPAGNRASSDGFYCVKYSTETVTLPLTYKLTVGTVATSGGRGGRPTATPLFSKDFTIPACN